MTLGIEKGEADAICLVNAHRLPQRAAINDAPPPIIAKFVYMDHRNRVLSAFEDNFSCTTRREAGGNVLKIAVRTDLPPALKTKRYQLSRIAFKLRKENNLSTKIAVVGIDVVLFQREKGTKKWNIHQG